MGVVSPVMMLIHTCAGGGGRDMLPGFFFDKNGAIWCILSVEKYVIINVKISNF